MDFKQLVPDFQAIGKTEWGKPKVDTKDAVALAGIIAALLMVVFVFLDWFSMGVEKGPLEISIGRSGISLWYGIIGLIGALAAVVGNLYNHKALAFSGGALGVIMGLIGWFMVPSLTFMGVEMPTAKVKEFLEAGAEASHLGAILFLIAAAVVAVSAFMGIAKDEKK